MILGIGIQTINQSYKTGRPTDKEARYRCTRKKVKYFFSILIKITLSPSLTKYVYIYIYLYLSLSL